jgi:hypothetical protein
MEERSTEHSPRIDDALADAVEPITRGAPVDGRVEERLVAEPADQGTAVTAVQGFAAPPLPGTLGEAERRQRSELAIALRPSAFPGERDTLRRTAENEHAPDWILELLDRLPIDTRFDTVQDVWLALGGHHELRDPSEATDEHVETPDTTPDVFPPELPRSPADSRSLVTMSLGVAYVGIGVSLSAVNAAATIARGFVRASQRLLHLGT